MTEAETAILRGSSGTATIARMRRRRPPEQEGDVVELLQGLGRILMAIDAKLDQIVNLLAREFGDGEDA